MPLEIEQLKRRCPRLGGEVFFDYCRGCGPHGQTCWKVFDCWWEVFDVVAYLRAQLPEDEFEALANARPQPKVLSLLELIEAARQRSGDDHEPV